MKFLGKCWKASNIDSKFMIIDVNFGGNKSEIIRRFGTQQTQFSSQQMSNSWMEKVQTHWPQFILISVFCIHIRVYEGTQCDVDMQTHSSSTDFLLLKHFCGEH